MALAFAGTAPFGAAILEALVSGIGGAPSTRRVSLVISQPSRRAGRGRTLTDPPVVEIAGRHRIDCIQPERMDDPVVAQRLEQAGVDVIIVAAFGQMIREPLLGQYEWINVHGSRLPAYRGAAPVERAIMDGLTATGVGIMQMEAGLDTGPVAAERTVSIGPGDDAGVVFAALEREGALALLDVLDLRDRGEVQWRPQPPNGATYAHKILAPDRVLDPRGSAAALHDRVRALSPHIGAWLEVDGARLGIWRTAVLSESPVLAQPGCVWHDAAALHIGTADAAVDVLELQPSGRSRMPASSWLRGLRAPLSAAAAPAGQSA